METRIVELLLKLKKMNIKMIKMQNSFLKECDVNPPYGIIFHVLSQRKKSMTVGEISKEILMPLPHVSSLCRNMEKDGYVVRTRDKNDARVVFVTLTEKACKISDKIQQKTNEFVKNARSKFTDDEYEKIVEAFDTVEDFFDRI